MSDPLSGVFIVIGIVIAITPVLIYVRIGTLINKIEESNRYQKRIVEVADYLAREQQRKG